MAETLKRLREAGAEVLDVSGGTQLVPLAAVRAGFRMLTYAYPTGRKLVFYPFKVPAMTGELIHVEKSVSLYQPDLIYQYAEAFREPDYVLIFRNAILALEEVSEGAEWNKRIVDARAWGLPVLWHGQLEREVPHLPQAPDDLVNRAEWEWMKWRELSMLARDAVSELYMLANFAALMLSPKVADKVLEDIEKSCRRGVKPGDAVGLATRYVRRLAHAYRIGLAVSKRLEISDERLSPEVDIQEKLFSELVEEIREVRAILFLPRIVSIPGIRHSEALLVKRQAELASWLIEKLKRPLIVISNKSIERQCQAIISMIKKKREKQKLAVKAVNIDGVDRDESRRDVVERLKKLGLGGASLLTVIADDYSKRLAFALLRALVRDLNSRVHVLIIPYVKIKALISSPHKRLDEMKEFWHLLEESRDVRGVFWHEVAYLKPDEIMGIVELLEQG